MNIDAFPLLGFLLFNDTLIYFGILLDIDAFILFGCLFFLDTLHYRGLLIVSDTFFIFGYLNHIDTFPLSGFLRKDDTLPYSGFLMFYDTFYYDGFLIYNDKIKKESGVKPLSLTVSVQLFCHDIHYTYEAYNPISQLHKVLILRIPHMLSKLPINHE